MNRLAVGILKTGVWCLVLCLPAGCSKHGPGPGASDDERSSAKPAPAAPSSRSASRDASPNASPDPGPAPAPTHSATEGDALAVIEACEAKVNAHCAQERSHRAEAAVFIDSAKRLRTHHQTLEAGIEKLSSLVQDGESVAANQKTYSPDDLKHLLGRIKKLLEDQRPLIERFESEATQQTGLAAEAASRCAEGRSVLSIAKKHHREIQSKERFLQAMQSPDALGMDEQKRKDFQGPLEDSLVSARAEMDADLEALAGVQEAPSISLPDHGPVEQALEDAGQLTAELSLLFGE